MCRIKVESGLNHIVVYVNGRLTGASVSQLEQCWKSTWAAGAGSPITLDLGGITSADKNARALLSQMVATGVQIQADGPRMRPVADSIIRSLTKG